MYIVLNGGDAESEILQVCDLTSPKETKDTSRSIE